MFSNTSGNIHGTNDKISEPLSRIKIQRIKRSWTQEYLAEKSNLSVRTIQRIESGTDVSPETLRILANTFGVEPETLKNTPDRIHFSAPWSRKLKVTSWIIVALLISTSFLYPIAQYFAVSIIIVCLIFSVRGYSVMNQRIVIHRLSWSKSFSINDLTELRIDPDAMMGSIRVCGVGGLFSFVGYFRNRILGTNMVYATDPANSIVLRFGKRNVVISPDSPLDFQKSVQTELKSQSGSN